MKYFGMIDFEKGNGRTEIQDFQHFYTDASKTDTGTAIAVYNAAENEILAESINNNFSITNAELLAILKALEIVKENNVYKAVILTDSRSACEMLLGDQIFAENYIAWEIYKEVQDLEQRSHKFKIKIQWIPSHVGIEGNEAADRAAVAATRERQTLFNSITLADAKLVSTKEIWENWTNMYKTISEEKGRWHYKIATTPGRQPWFKDMTLNPNQIKILNRIRSGHTLTKERRALWKLEIDDECDLCEEQENLQHVLYHCPQYNNIRVNYNALEYMKPLESIFKEECEIGMKEIFDYIKEAKIQI
nr:uncharacterized protein LOC115266451 [Aedes albopictus]